LGRAQIRDPELDQALGWRLAIQGEVRSAMVVLVLSFAKLLHELGRGAEDRPSVEFSASVRWLRSTFPLASVVPGGIRRWAMPRSWRCQVNSLPNSELWSVWTRWMATGKRRRTSSINAIPDLTELCS